VTHYLRTLMAAALVCATSVAGAADSASSRSQTGQQMSGADSASVQMHHQMMDGMKQMQSMQPSGDIDRDYAKMIEQHHAQAVKMTQAYLKGAKDPQLKSWAQKSLDSQQKELKELRAMNVTGGSSRQADAGKQ
jgi:uncharacterized protein (DUF305 family)